MVEQWPFKQLVQSSNLCTLTSCLSEWSRSASLQGFHEWRMGKLGIRYQAIRNQEKNRRGCTSSVCTKSTYSSIKTIRFFVGRDAIFIPPLFIPNNGDPLLTFPCLRKVRTATLPQLKLPQHKRDGKNRVSVLSTPLKRCEKKFRQRGNLKQGKKIKFLWLNLCTLSWYCQGWQVIAHISVRISYLFIQHFP